ncbi:MAG: 50S ribosomal protein L32e [Nitrososphaerota archaeon]|nr:50S ribosomal protein L32e [Candidatus Bathyarchaeota archaeon]MCX8162855.1 50S ribosomal protein L32e [Candidatus Bathyarchaeota archaeon]MDW8062489.1 50S ribosomal protein L32e [Nitrososphaerota archaeon]
MGEEAQQVKRPSISKPKLSDRERHLLRLRMERDVEFVRQESWRYVRVKDRWRKPRGVSSKMRRRMSGWPRVVSVGYGAPRAVRGLHPSGFREVLVYNEKSLEGLNPERDAIRIAHTVGMRRRRVILDKAKQLGLKVLNPGIIAEVEAR